MDFKSFDKNGYLEEKDYNTLTKDWLEILNPVRVKPIRKQLLFTNLKYEVYKKEAVKTANEVETLEDKIDLEFVPLYFVSTFSSTFFPDFQTEYFAPFSFLTNKNCVSLEGLKVIQANQYHSLTIATYEIEEVIKERFAKTKKFKDFAEDLIVYPTFLLPFDIDSYFPLTIILNVNMQIK
ncbi:MAG: hypothetical protein WC511_01625 [Candidatus Pacearchaeota archaeon]